MKRLWKMNLKMIEPFPLDPYPQDRPFNPPDIWDEEFYDEEE